jgi:hypothetical protein
VAVSPFRWPARYSNASRETSTKLSQASRLAEKRLGAEAQSFPRELLEASEEVLTLHVREDLPHRPVHLGIGLELAMGQLEEPLHVLRLRTRAGELVRALETTAIYTRVSAKEARTSTSLR